MNLRTGLDALKALNAPKSKLHKWENNKPIQVVFHNPYDVAVVEIHNVYPSVKSMLKNELTERAAEMLITDAKKIKDKEKNKEAYKRGKALKASPKVWYTFYDLNSGAPIVAEFSPTQSKVVDRFLTKNADKLSKRLVEIERVGEGTSTTFTINLVDSDDLTDDVKKRVVELASQPIDHEIFKGVLGQPEESFIVEQLTNYGFDVTRLGLSKDSKAIEDTKHNEFADDGKSIDLSDDDLPF